MIHQENGELVRRHIIYCNTNAQGDYDVKDTFGPPEADGTLDLSNGVSAYGINPEYSETFLSGDDLHRATGGTDEGPDNAKRFIAGRYLEGDELAKATTKVVINAMILDPDGYTGDDDDGASTDNPENSKLINKAVYRCNIMEYARTLTTFGQKYTYLRKSGQHPGFYQVGDESDASVATVTGLAFGLLYCILLVEAIMFSIQYLKRVLKLAFLTMIAPLVALMYPIDKLGDGQAQAFNRWFKDYMFDILIQPLHLLLYTIFITAAVNLINKNPVYAVAVYMFMMQAEKYFKDLFGFNKASGGGGPSMAGMMGANALGGAFRRMAGFSGPGGNGGGSGGSSKPGKVRGPRHNSDGSNRPASSGSGSGSGGGDGSGSGGTGGSSGNGGASGSGAQRPGSNGKNGRLDRLRRVARKRILGGKSKGKYAGDKAKKLGGRAVRMLGRGAGAALMGAAGAGVGIITAAATGNYGDVAKFTGLGLASGWNQGGRLTKYAQGKVGDINSDLKEQRRIDDIDYDRKQYAKETREQLRANGVEEDDLPDNDTINLAYDMGMVPTDDLSKYTDIKTLADDDDFKDASGQVDVDKVKAFKNGAESYQSTDSKYRTYLEQNGFIDGKDEIKQRDEQAIKDKQDEAKEEAYKEYKKDLDKLENDYGDRTKLSNDKKVEYNQRKTEMLKQFTAKKEAMKKQVEKQHVEEVQNAQLQRMIDKRKNLKNAKV